eukprot:Gb_28552 [translate_table: standard]
MTSLSWTRSALMGNCDSGQTLFLLSPPVNPGGYFLWVQRGCWKQLGVPNVRSSVEKGAGGGSFVKYLDDLYPRLPCRICKGRSKVVCDKCDGKGNLARGGYQKKNPVDLDRIIGSKWTAMEATFGWRHFIVHSKQRGLAKEWFLEMVATCDKNTHFWINSKNLKDRDSWSMGWLQRVELVPDKEKAKDLSFCKACKGEGRLTCTACIAHNGSTVHEIDIIEV